MQVQTENQAIVFHEEASDNEEFPAQAQKGIIKGQQLITNELPLPDPSEGSQNSREQNQKPGPLGQDQAQEVKATAQLPLYELDIGEEYVSEKEKISEKDHQKIKKNDQKLKASIEDPVFQQPSQISNKKVNTENISKAVTNSQTQSQRLNGRGKARKFTNINSQDPTLKKSHKIVKKAQSNFEAGNITKGLFNQAEPEVENQTTQYELNKKNQTEPFQRLNNSISSPNQHRKLPPLIASPKKQYPPEPTKQNQISPNKILVNDPNDSSIACLQKYEKNIKQPQQNELQHKSSFIYEEEDENISKLAMKKVPVSSRCKAKVLRQKSCPQNFYHPQFSLLLENNKFLLNSKKEWGHINSQYNISLQRHNYGKDLDSYAGYVKGNFTGTCFNLFEIVNHKPELSATICYKPQIKCSSSYRKLEVYIKNEQYGYNQLEGAEEDQGIDLQELYSVGQNSTFRKIIKLVNKEPEWSEAKKCFVLSFRGKSNFPSVKNMIIVDPSNRREGMLFCKADINQFYMEVSHPLTPFIAFGIVLTAFDFKLLCQ